jgi:hypothetical protein
MKLGMYIMATEPISTGYFINPSHQSVSACVSPAASRQRLDNKVTAATNAHEIVELLDVLFSMLSMLHQRNVDD